MDDGDKDDIRWSWSGILMIKTLLMMTKKLLMMRRLVKPASEDKLVAVAQLFHTSGIDQLTSL